LAEKNTKPFWRYIKAKKQDSVGVAPLKYQGQLHSEDRMKADILNKQFCSVFTQEGKQEYPTVPGDPAPSIANIVVETSGVQKLLMGLKVSKASGPDNFPNVLLKHTATEIAPALAAIFNMSLTQGKLPTNWSQANISPVFKKGSKQEAANYRPVSLTCVCCKLLEHIVCHHVRAHLDEQNILSQYQHGFRKGHSCESQLLVTSQ
jgi:hypothetical protein